MFVENTISIYASNVVFFIMLSFFPFAMFFFTILKYIPGITQENLIPMIGSVVPGELGETLVSWIQEAYRHSSGTVLSLSALTALWAGSKGFMGITYGLNRIGGTKQKGNWFFNRFLSFLYTLIFAAMLVLSLIVIVFGNQILLIIDSFFSIPLFHITMNARIYEIMYPVLYLPLLHGSYSAISTRSISILFRIIHLFMGVSLRSHSLCCGCMSVSVCCLSVL